MVDAKSGATDLDSDIARQLRKQQARTLLVVNKVDKPHDPVTHDFHRLGLGDPIPISSENGFGIGDLLDEILALFPPRTGEEARPEARVAIVGRPNVGKSSIVNALLGEERMVVEAVAGTTMDAVDSLWETPAGRYLLVDTAGIRRQAKFEDQSEFYAVVRAYHALERADVACLVVDAGTGFQNQDARLAHGALDAGCSLLLVYNKWDLMEEREAAWKRLTADRARRYPTLGDIPSLPLSATVRTHVHRLPAAIQQRVGEHARKIPTSQLNEWLKTAQRKRAVPSTKSGYAPRIYYATQTAQGPPEVTLFVNEPSRLSENYRRFLWLHFCEHFGFHATPVRMRYRKSE
jgi:GTP-binding protein